MFSCSIEGLLFVWQQLVEARYDVNSYGGDTAEIYVFKVRPYDPSNGNNPFNREEEQVRKANKALLQIFEHFEQEYHVKLLVEGRELGEWMVDSGNSHRWHVKVEREE